MAVVNERAQLLCELTGLATGGAGALLVGIGLGGLVGAGIALMVLAAPLVVVGNLSTRKRTR